MLGPVFRTYDAEHDRLVAVKAFRLDIVPEDVARLADALRRAVSGRAAHAAIVAPIEAGLESSTAFLASEYVAAETLDVALRHLAPAPLSVAVPFLRAMAEAIDASWQAGAAQGHGALHPRDVFVSPGTNDVRISGFGVVPALESVGIKAPVRRPYTAPERHAGGAATWDVRADVFSLGAIAHELLTGRRPAGPGEQDGALPSSITPEIRVRIRRVLSAALAERPGSRFGSARAFVDALETAGTSDVLPSLPFEAVEQTAAAGALSPEPAAAPVVVPLPELPTLPPSRVDLDLVTTSAPAPSPEPSMFDLDDVMDIRASADGSPAGDEHLRFDAAAAASIAPDAPLARASQSVGPTLNGTRDDGSAAPNRDPDLSGLDFVGSSPAASAAPMFSFGPAETQTPSTSSSSSSRVALLIMFVAGAIVGGVAVALFAIGRPQPTVTPTTPTPTVATPPQPDTAHQLPPGTDVPVTPAAQSPAAAPQTTSEAKPAAPAAHAATTGRVNVRSTPTGASVSIDGKARGRTPLTIRDLAFGEHAIVVSRAGFAADTRTVTISADAPAGSVVVDLHARTTPAAPKAAAKMGVLFVDTRPSGATVVLDGKSMGVTPLQVADLTIGSHTLRVTLAGYKPIATTVDVAAGDPTRFTVTLERIGLPIARRE